MLISLRNISYTSLKYEAFYVLIEKYAKSLKLKKDIDVVFDKRVTTVDGYHKFDVEKQKHIIMIAPNVPQEIQLQKYQYIAVLLHELKHACQREMHGHHFSNSKFFSIVQGIDDNSWSEWYSRAETEARMYENKHLHDAVDFYENSCK